MKKYCIYNNGCDDTTITNIELTDTEYKAIVKFINANNENSTYQCEPTLEIEEGFYNE